MASGREQTDEYHQQFAELEYLRSFGLFGLWQLWQSSGPGGRVHFMIAEKSSDVKVKRVSRLAESKARCCRSDKPRSVWDSARLTLLMVDYYLD